MRGIRMLFLTTTIGAMVLLSPSGAAANGGAYVEFDRTFYVAGDEGHGVTYVSLPAGKEHLLDEGPFHLFALPRGASLREGHPIPSSAIRLGTVTVTEEDGSYEFETDFIVPDLDPGWYEIGVCNDPCTISGFRESLGGSFSIVETRREAQLMTANGRLRGQLAGARVEARRAERRLAEAEDELEAQLAFGGEERTELAAEIDRLQTQLASARSRAAHTGRTPFDPWLVGAILLVTLVIAVLAFRRGRMVPAMTDL
jgi:predicted aminopeptidase